MKWSLNRIGGLRNLVSGEVNADYFVVAIESSTIKERKIQNKSFMVTLDRGEASGAEVAR
jgi:hypothetical protein